MNKIDKEEWGAWKIVSDMLDKPDIHGIYPTSECYQKLYEFVINQKAKAKDQEKKIFENGMASIKDLKHRCPQCGKEAKMSYQEAYRLNALWGKCFECANKAGTKNEPI